MASRFFVFFVFSVVIINMKAQSSYLLLPSISDYTDLLEPYQNRIQTAIDAFFDETQIEVNVISAYRFAQDEPFKIKDIWKESANFSLLITVNLHEDLQPLDWEWGANIALTNSVDAEEELPFSLLEYAKTEVMLPILQGLPDAEGRTLRSPEKYAEAIIQVLEFIKEKKKTNVGVLIEDIKTIPKYELSTPCGAYIVSALVKGLKNYPRNIPSSYFMESKEQVIKWFRNHQKLVIDKDTF